MQPTHAFVVPAYRESPHLRDCLESLRMQTRPSEVVISTSTPNDLVEALAADYGARLCVHGPNAGIGRDWNRAVGAAGTEWITLAHQDDIYLPEFAQRTMAAAAAHPRATLVMTGYSELVAGNPRSGTPMLQIKRLLLEMGFLGRTAIGSSAAKRRLLRFGCPIPCPSVSLRLDRGLPKFREDLKVNLDWDAWIRLASEPGAFVFLRDVLMSHRIHEDSETSGAVRGGVRAAEDLVMFRALWPGPIARLLARAYAGSYTMGGER